MISGLRTNIHLSDEQMAEFAEANRAKVVEELRRVLQTRKEDGIDPEYSLVEDGGEYFIRPESRDYIPYRSLLLRKTDTEFEQFCASVLSRLGARAVWCGGTNDGGIDFFAFNLPIQATQPLSSATPVPNILFGQAKRYAPDNLVGEAEVREFIGSAINKQNEFILRGEASILTPCILTFWTTSDFTSSARGLCRNHGIWCLSGFAVARMGMLVGVDASE